MPDPDQRRSRALHPRDGHRERLHLLGARRVRSRPVQRDHVQPTTPTSSTRRRSSITDNSRWAQYLKPDVKDAVYYVNTLEYVASPMANLGLRAPRHHARVARRAARLREQRAPGGAHAQGGRAALPRPGRRARAVSGSPTRRRRPTTTSRSPIPSRMEAALGSAARSQPRPTRASSRAATDGYYLTLSIFEVDDAIEGTRAEWSVYVDDGSGRPNLMVARPDDRGGGASIRSASSTCRASCGTGSPTAC